MMLSLMMTVVAATTACTPVPGSEQLWRPSARWIIVGAPSGNNEMPDAFANLACLAAAKRPVTVALEYPTEAQPSIDAWLASDGGAAAQAAVLGVPVTKDRYRDSRASAAFLRLLERLRVMKQTGQIRGVFAFGLDASTPTSPERDAVIANRWKAKPVPDGGMVMVLTPSIYATRLPVELPGLKVPTAGSLMPAEDTVTVLVIGNGGTTWGCDPSGCGVRSNGDAREAAVGVTFLRNANRRFDAVYDLGVPTTASEPAIQGK